MAYGGFTGRADELERLTGALDRTTVVTGLGGVGKTALVAELCQRVRADVHWIQATSRVATTAALRGTPKADLVIFDGVPHPGWIEDLLPDTPAIVTSRCRDWPDDLPTIKIDPLSQDETTELLARQRPDDDGARRLATRLDGLPLAIADAAAYCRDNGCGYDAYARLLDASSNEVLGPGTALGRLFHTILADVLPDAPLADAVLGICAHLSRITTEVFEFASAEPLLQNGDPAAALHALERFSVLTGAETYRMHRLVQAVCRANAGDEYARAARRMRRRRGDGWDYFVADSGSAIVAMERATGRLLLTRTTGGDEPVELPLPPPAVDPPTTVEVTDAHVVARYPTGTATWTLGPPATATETHLLTDSDDTRVDLPDGRTLHVWGGSPLTLELGDWSRDLDPGSYSGSRRVVAMPVIDPTGTWLLVSMYMSKVVDHGWIAAWRLADVLDDTVEVEDGDEDGFLPNSHDWAGDVDNPNATANEEVTGLCFDSAGGRLYLLDRRTIHGWSWPGQQALWRVRRPEVVPLVRDVHLGAAVEACVRVTRTDHIRAALADGRVVDIDPVELVVRTIGDAVPVAAMSPADGAIMPASAGIRSAFGTDDGAFVCRTDRDRLVRREINGRTTDLRCAAPDLVSVHHSGTAAVVRDGLDLRHVAIGRMSTRELSTASRNSDPDRPVMVGWMTAHRVLALCDSSAWWATSDTIDQLEFWSAEVTALAADGHVVVAGSEDGDVLLHTYDGMRRHDEGTDRFTVRAADEPVRWVFPLLADNLIVAVTPGGQLSVVRWG